MTDCTQLQALLDDAIQNRKDLNDPTYCDDFPDPEHCRQNLGAQKREAEQGIQDIKQNMIICNILIGMWAINADDPQFSSQVTINAYDSQTGVMASPHFDFGTFTAATNAFSFFFPDLTYTGILDVTNQPFTITGTYSGNNTLSGINGTWTGQKQ